MKHRGPLDPAQNAQPQEQEPNRTIEERALKEKIDTHEKALKALKERLKELDHLEDATPEKKEEARLKLSRMIAEIEEELRNLKSTNGVKFFDGGSYCILALFGLTIYLIFFSRAKLDFWNNIPWKSEINHYKILDASPKSGFESIKSNFNRLKAMWDPRFNPNCTDCDLKTAELNNAYEMLSDPKKRKLYDEENGVKDLIRSNSVELTPENYDHLMSTDEPKLVQVYEHGSKPSLDFAPYWEQLQKAFPFIKFLRADNKGDLGVLKKLPINARDVPTVFLTGKGIDTQIAPLNLKGNPASSLKRFLNEALDKNLIEKPLQDLPKLRNGVAFIAKKLLDPIKANAYAVKLKNLFGLKTYFVKSSNLTEHVQILANGKNDTMEINQAGDPFRAIELSLFRIFDFNKDFSREMYEKYCMGKENSCVLHEKDLSKPLLKEFETNLNTTINDYALNRFVNEHNLALPFTFSINHHSKLGRRMAKDFGSKFDAIVINNPQKEFGTLNYTKQQDYTDFLNFKNIGKNMIPFEKILKSDEHFNDLVTSSHFWFVPDFLSSFLSNIFNFTLLCVYAVILLLCGYKMEMQPETVGLIILAIHSVYTLATFIMRHYL